MSERIYDFAVIGAGMAGASIAAELCADARVLVIEAEETPGYHATGRSAAFWEECYGGPQIVPLTLASGPYLREHGFLDARGALYIGRGEDCAALDRFVATFADSGATIERLDAQALSQKVPLLRGEWCDAVWEPACADIDVAGLHVHYLKRLRQHKVPLKARARLTHANHSKGVWEAVCENGARFYTRGLINAAGAWADEVATRSGVAPIGIVPKRRTVAQIRVTPAVDKHQPLVLDINGQFYFKPDNGKLWLSPHDEIDSAPCDAAARELDVALAIDRFEKATNWRIEQVERRWAGLRSFAPDRLPVYGRAPDNEAFIWFAGQGGFGIQTAPAAARACAQALLGNGADAMTRDLSLATYAPERFGWKTCERSAR